MISPEEIDDLSESKAKDEKVPKVGQDRVVFICITMPNIRFRNLLDGHPAKKKVPLNTVVLPPLATTGLSQAGAEFIANLIVNKSKTNDLVSLANNGRNNGCDASSTVATGKATEATPSTAPATPATKVLSAAEGAQVTQLEQNVKFLQDKHRAMLADLHQEIDWLRHRNRELQFQLIFAKGAPSTPSSPEDETKQKMYSTSPKNVNATPLQVEILDRELGELRLHLQESENRNVYLSAIVDEQKKKLERYERDRERELDRSLAAASVAPPPPLPPPTTLQSPDPELLRKLDDADSLIRRLRSENSELRREIATTTTTTNPVTSPSQTTPHPPPTSPPNTSYNNYQQSPRDYHQQQQQQRDRGDNNQQYRGGGGQHHGHRGNNGGNNGGRHNNRGNHHYRNWFPPLQQQQQQQQHGVTALVQNQHTYWPSTGNHHNRTGGSVESSVVANLPSGGCLPNLPLTSGNGGNTVNNTANTSQNGEQRRGNNNHHQYHHNRGGGGGENRKYRGGGHNNHRGSKPS